MSIERIDDLRCIGCGECLSTCPAEAFSWDELREQPLIRDPDVCFSCSLCQIFCPADAIILAQAALIRAAFFPA